MGGKCKIALSVEVQGRKYKVVDPKDPCASVNKVLAKQEGSTMITPAEYRDLVKKS